MSNTFSQIYIQIVFAVQNRQHLIRPKHEEELFKYMTGIVQNKGHKLISINGMPDHIHVFLGLKPNEAISDVVRDLKKDSSKLINSKNWVRGKFSWQEGYGGFSYGHSQIKDVARYIENQKIHHKKRSFKEEYIGLLNKFQIDYEEKYLFKWIDY
ncbi:MAG: IS200/IS605 family transposase [Candidatus Marinimicrobia bacterium]|nr:IS200/IS605 family transposase [Candidatus Neomarinimicrobiota bacterium]